MPASSASDSLEKFQAFQREVNRLFRRIFEEGANAPAAGESVPTRADVSEAGGDVVVEVETPGTPFESLALWVSRDLIVVEGEKPVDAHDGKITWHCMERDFGPFRRVVEIPCPVDTNAIRATYRAGLLTIVCPKIEDRRESRRRVPIERL
ncbi:MAG TPA: Hsp20/alpha crystallin family protein [bacterium]|nr:Hsp20/alpha crystallin family protein [bacterium]